MFKKFLVAALVVVIATISSAVLADEYYEIGSNPAAPDRVINPDTEAIVKISEDSPVLSMTCAGGKVASGKKIHQGQMIVVDKATHVAKWVAVCGNEITDPKDWVPKGQVMFLSWKDVQSAPVVSSTSTQPQLQQAAAPQRVDITVHQDQQPAHNADQPNEHYGFWDMVAASFAQAFAQGLGQGLAYQMVWNGPGYGGYGGYGGFAPVVYYPSPAYYGGGGGGDVFITKNITKVFYVNSFNSSSTTITNPGGPRGGGGPVDPPADPGSGGGGTGGGPTDPGANRAQRNNAGRGEMGTRKPLTESQIARDFRGQSETKPAAHGPTVGNNAWTGNGSRSRQITPRQTTPHGPTVGNQSRQNAPRYATPPIRGGWQQPRVMPRQQQMPRQYQYRAPAYRPSAPAFRGGRR